MEGLNKLSKDRMKVYYPVMKHIVHVVVKLYVFLTYRPDKSSALGIL